MIQGRFLLLLCIVAVTVGTYAPETYAPETCTADIPAATNFNASQFAGTWYEVGGNAAAERHGTCEISKYIANPDGTLILELSWLCTHGVKHKLTGTGKNVGTKCTDAKLSIQYEKRPPIIYTIFYLAYDKFFAIYSCIDNESNIWAFSKSPEVSHRLAKFINTVVSNTWPGPSSFKLKERKGCAALNLK